jgi:drug/metabolite transporter (DMT)-like permease
MQNADRVALVLLGVVWGGGFLFIRIAVPSFGPLVLVDLRVLIADWFFSYGPPRAKGFRPFWRRWREYLVLGALNVALPFTLIAWAALTVSASLSAIMMATIPLFTAPSPHSIERTSFGTASRRLIVGFIGVGILVGLNPLPMTLSSEWP